MKSLKMKSILFLALAGCIEARPRLNDTMKDVNPTPDVNSSLVANPASPEVYPASEEGPTPDEDSSTEIFPTGETGEMIISRTRRSIKKCKKKCKGSKKKKSKCKKECKKDKCKGKCYGVCAFTKENEALCTSKNLHRALP